MQVHSGVQAVPVQNITLKRFYLQMDLPVKLQNLRRLIKDTGVKSQSRLLI